MWPQCVSCGPSVYRVAPVLCRVAPVLCHVAPVCVVWPQCVSCVQVSEDLVVRLQYITRRRHKKRDPAVKEAGSEPHPRRLFFSNSSPVASHHRKLLRLKKDADTANGSGARAHALPSGRHSSGEPHVMGSLQLPVASRLERHDCSFVETQL